jgi:hypothetical protein
MPTAGTCCAEWCARPIEGADIGTRVEQRRLAEGGPLLVYSAMKDSAGPLDPPTGTRVAVYHRKCWWAVTKRDRVMAAAVADPSGHPGDADWRDPVTCDAEDQRGVLGRADRGDRASPG